MHSLPHSPALFCLDVRDKSRPSAAADPSISSWCCPKCKRPLKYQDDLGFFAHYTGAPLCAEANQIGLNRFVEHVLKAALTPKALSLKFSTESLELECDGQVFSTTLSTHLKNPEQVGNEIEVLALIESLAAWLKDEGILAEAALLDAHQFLEAGKKKTAYAHENQALLTSDRFNPDEITILELVEARDDKTEAQSQNEKANLARPTVSTLKQRLQSQGRPIEALDLKMQMRAILTSDWVKKCQLKSTDIASLRTIHIDMKGVANPMEGWWALLWLDAFTKSEAAQDGFSNNIESLLEAVVLRCDLLTDSIEAVRSVIEGLLSHVTRMGLVQLVETDNCFRFQNAASREDLKRI